MLLECVHSLRALIEDKHANCIAERAVSSAAAAAAAAQKESLAGTFFGTMMDAAAGCARMWLRQRVRGLVHMCNGTAARLRAFCVPPAARSNGAAGEQ
eukprot:scaffold13400_cov98-Phaeocystis_antarctica.AAC.1